MRKNIKRIKITRNIFTHFPGSMIKPKFFGREKELALLRKQRDIVREQHTSRFVVVSGRRRVGKTRLILEALSSTEDMPTIYTYLNPQLDEASNLTDFSLAFQDGLGVRHAVRFSSFEEAISSVFDEAAARPITLVIDEFQNLSHLNPGKLRKSRRSCIREQSAAFRSVLCREKLKDDCRRQPTLQSFSGVLSVPEYAWCAQCC